MSGEDRQDEAPGDWPAGGADSRSTARDNAAAARLEAHLRALIPVLPEGADIDSLDHWRDRIDILDRLILTLLNERAVCANRIGRLKKLQGTPVYVPSREEDVLRNVRNANQGPLPDAAVRHLFERIIDEIRSLERRFVQDEQRDE